ncbi:Sec-independent protein translocase protein TatC [Candidatus Desulfarcum epimagneticum]|uniref:Sec-independent protein translocase protein TatC n=1 Tax=uncultured Desulfobacteraceae bacterium TaxID=218296 RepID=A0A484HH06_9BACT|nr:Sec-independent protein translocase protein TatC [uncultured Desulfobacteraceae bacterium]
MDEESKLPFTSHLDELRKRLIVCFVAVGVGFAASYFFKEILFEILMTPLKEALNPGDTLIFTGLPEAFFTYLKVAFLSGLILAAPVILYEFWMFVAPGLYKNERRALIPIVILSSFFFVGGALFGYFVVFPFGFRFFLGFATEIIRPMPSMREYLSFASRLLLAFGLVFELPLVLTFFVRMGIVSIDFLKRNRKYALLIFFAGAAILTPPDVVTQVMMAGPLMALYEISIIGAKVFGGKKGAGKDEKKEKSDDGGEKEPPD